MVTRRAVSLIWDHGHVDIRVRTMLMAVLIVHLVALLGRLPRRRASSITASLIHRIVVVVVVVCSISRLDFRPKVLKS